MHRVVVYLTLSDENSVGIAVTHATPDEFGRYRLSRRWDYLVKNALTLGFSLPAYSRILFPASERNEFLVFLARLLHSKDAEENLNNLEVDLTDCSQGYLCLARSLSTVEKITKLKILCSTDVTFLAKLVSQDAKICHRIEWVNISMPCRTFGEKKVYLAMILLKKARGLDRVQIRLDAISRLSCKMLLWSCPLP